jgi:dTDP-4-dehydrorhamnose 3,5-epimerase
LRGLHFQYQPHSEVKLVKCSAGAIWDVMVDLRENSPHFGSWFGTTLSNENGVTAYIPAGFAHGFLTLAPRSEVIYFSSEFYTPESEGTLSWDDAHVGIKWPARPLTISEKDRLGGALISLSPSMNSDRRLGC